VYIFTEIVLLIEVNVVVIMITLIQLVCLLSF